MKRHLFIYFMLFSAHVFSQQLYVPGGTVGASANSNVGIGTNNPKAGLEVSNSTKAEILINRNGFWNGSNSGLILSTDAANTDNWTFGMKANGTNNIYLNRNNRNDLTILDSSGNVGIGTTSPQAKLHVAGNVRVDNVPSSTSYGDQMLVVDTQGNIKKSSSTNDRIYNNVLFYSSSCATINNGVKIKTNIPYPSNGFGGEMPTINIEGFAYGEGKTIGLNINWYVWSNQFYPTTNISSYGGYTPVVKLTTENDKIVIFLEDKTYCLNFGVKAIGAGDPSYYQGWTAVDEPIVGSIVKKLDYKNAFGNVKVDGKLEAKEIKVTLTPTADFVFSEDYRLPKLEDVEKHIKDKKHLPDIASAKEMEKEGVNVGEFQIKLLQKIEELTLYSIEQNKRINKVQQENKELRSELQQLKKK